MRNPVNAPYHNDKYPLPVGWSANENGERVYLVPGNTDTLNDNDSRIHGERMLTLDRLRDNMSWLANGTNFDGSYAGTANGFLNWVLRMQFTCSGSGHVITITNGPPNDDPRNIVWFDNETILSPGDVFFINNQNARVVSVDYDTDPSETYVTTHKALTFDEGTYFCYREQVYPLYTYPRPFVSDWFPTRSSSVRIVNPTGQQLLHDGKIAFWYGTDPDWRQTLKVVKNTIDLADTVIAGELIWIDFVDGGWKTYIDLSSLGTGIYDVTYFQATSDASNGHRPTQQMCEACIRDFSDSYPDQNGVDDDENGNRWFCQFMHATLDGERRVPDANLAKFNFPCIQTKCPSFAINTPWQVSAADHHKALINRNIFLLETGERTNDYLIGRSSNPSLCYMAGMVNTITGGLYVPQESWLNGSCYGKLISKPEADKAADEGAVQIIKTGSILEDGEGVMADVAYNKTDRIGGRGPGAQGLYDDGSFVYTVETQHPARDLGVISTSNVVGVGQGRGEYAVQRVRQYPVIMDITKDAAGETADGLAAWTFDATHCHIRIKALARDFPTKQTGVKIYSATVDSSLDYLTIQFVPAVNTVLYHIAGELSDRDSRFVSAGNVVMQPPWLTINNPGASFQSFWGSSYYRLSRGDSINFSSGLPANLQSINLTCVYAKPFAGSLYSSSIDGVDPTDNPDSRAPGVPDFYDDYTQRTKMDVAKFDLNGYEAQQIADWLEANTLDEGETLEVHNENVFPPEIYFDPSGYDYTDYDVALDIDGVVTLDFDYDAANGYFRVAKSLLPDQGDVQVVLASDHDQNPYIITRENSCPAELLLRIEDAHKALKWIDAGSFGASADFEIQSTKDDSLDEIASIETTFFQPETRIYYEIDGATVSEKETPLASYSNPMIRSLILQADSSVSASGDPIDVFLKTGNTAGNYQAGVVALSEGIWTVVNVVGSYKGYKLTDNSFLGRFPAGWIDAAKVDIKISGGTMSHYYGNTPTPGATIDTTSDLKIVIGAVWAVENAGYLDILAVGGSAFSVDIASAEQGKWKTVDVTEIAKQACLGNVPGDPDLYLFVIGAGDVDLAAFDIKDLDRLFYSSCDLYNITTEGYVQGSPFTGGGSLAAIDTVEIDCYSVQYTGFEMRNFKIAIDHEAMINDEYLPNLPYDSNHANNLPQ